MSAASRRAKAHKQTVKNGTQTFNNKNLSNQISALQSQITAGAAPSAAETDYQNKITGATAPAADETALSTSLGNIKGASALGQANAIDPLKNPVALGFQTGQAGAIDTQANAASVPLTERLALLQQNRRTALEGYNTGLTNARSNREMTNSGSATNLGFKQNQYDTESANFMTQQAQKQALAVAKANNKAKASTDVKVKAAPKAKVKAKPKAKAKSKRSYD